MLDLFYNYARQVQVPPSGGVPVIPKMAYADYIIASLTVDAAGITRGGTIAELPEPDPTEEWADKRRFVSAITALLPDEAKAALAADWQTQAWIAKLPGDAVNLLDSEVAAFLAAAGLTLEQVREKMEG